MLARPAFPPYGPSRPYVLSSLLPSLTRRFGISEAEIQKNIDASNAFYGAGHPNATRILYPNGEVDPWKSQGILVSPGPDLPVMLVEGASHHAWTHPSLPSDQPSVVQARLDIKKQVAAWLQEQ
jgi:serine protease 16